MRPLLLEDLLSELSDEYVQDKITPIRQKIHKHIEIDKKDPNKTLEGYPRRTQDPGTVNRKTAASAMRQIERIRHRQRNPSRQRRLRPVPKTPWAPTPASES